MKSATPKVLHEICGRSLLGHVVAASRSLSPEHLVVVVGHAREQVTAHLAEVDAEVRTAVQHEQNGTGHAVRMGLEELTESGVALDGTVVVTCGDTPLLTGGTLQALADTHTADGNAVTVLTARGAGLDGLRPHRARPGQRRGDRDRGAQGRDGRAARHLGDQLGGVRVRRAGC